MKVEPEDLAKFKELYKAEYGTDLSEAEASEIAGNLVSLYELLCELLPYDRDKATQPGRTEESPASPSQQ